eukprot:scaffold686_cov177-Ochromonas_danica.AAC.17
MTDKEKTRKNKRENSLWVVGLLILLGGIIEWSSYYSLPHPLRGMEKEGQGQQQQLAGADHAEISVSHARKYLQDLTEIGPRVTGSNANEYVTPKWLLDRLHAVKTNIISPDIHLDIVLQTPSSSFYIDFLGGMNNVYSNVTNVIARLSSKNIPSTSSSILVNAHFDSVPGSPGAADDGVGIAIMLELIRVLSTTPAGSNSPPLLDKPVIFLFNGAEEWVHHGAHGFISQHEWAKDVEYLINLEAIGSGGRELVFQCNSGYIAGLYGDAAPYPQASVLAHELFKHLLYKVASTDWKTFIEYGHQLYGKHVRGVDTAYVDNGYVYHTTFDSIDMIPDGTLINTGENILHLIKAMAKYAPSSPRSPVDGTSLDDQENAKDRRKFTGEKLRKVDEVMKKDEQAVIHATLVMVVPLFGKTGTVVPTDIALGGMIAIHLGLPLGSFLSNHLHQRLHKSTIRSGIMVLLAIYLWLMLGRSSYSVHHPKRLWIQRVERYYRHVDPDLPGHKWRYLPPHIRKQLQAPSKSNSDFEVVSDEGVWLSGFDERGIDLLMPYIYHYYDGTAAGTSTPIFGLLGESLAYLQSMHRTYLSPNPLDLERNMDCSMWNGDCFFSFPWYFPVPDALRHGVYLPLHSAPRHAEGKHLDFARVPLDNKLKVITRSHSLNKDEINNLVVVNGGLKQQLESCTLDQNAVYRLIEIDIFGPSHVNLAIRDEENGERVTAWWLDDLVFRPISGVEDRANVLDHLSCSAARRNEGLHYFHIASGRCDPSTKDNQPYLCTHRRLFFLVRGTEPVELVVYGHYVDLVDDNQVVGLINSLPPWSRGSEWTKFPSVLLSDLV